MRVVTSVVIVPPLSVQALALPLLRQYAYDFPRRIPAHISVLYPFVMPDKLDAARDALRDVCATMSPFVLTVSGYGTFPGVTFLRVEPSDALQRLITETQRAFPQCVPYEGMFDGTPEPHITVGVFNSANKQQRAQFPDYPPQTFTVDRVHVCLGPETHIVNWIVHDVVRFG